MTWYVCRICFMVQRTCFCINRSILMISGHFSANLLNRQKFMKIPKIAIFAKNQFFSKCFICFHMMIYAMKCHLGTLKSHLKSIYDIHDVIRAFFGKSIFFDFWARKNFFLIFVDAEITDSAIFWRNFHLNDFIYIITLLEKKCQQ